MDYGHIDSNRACPCTGALRHEATRVTEFIPIVVSIFGLIGLGFLCAKSGYLAADAGQGLADFVFKLAIPVLLARTLAHADFVSVDPWPLWGAYFGGVAVVWIAGYVTIRHGFGRDVQASAVGGISAIFANTVLVGIPVIQAAYGDAKLVFALPVLAINLLFIMTASLIVNEIALAADGIREARINMREILRPLAGGLAKNPIIIGIACGVLWRASGLEPYRAIGMIIDSLAGVAGPLALVAVGMSLSTYGATRHYLAASSLSVLKLVGHPLAVLGLGSALGLEGAALSTIVLLAAAPTGVHAYILANQFGTGQALASNTVAISTGIAVLPIAGWLLVLQMLFG